MHNPAEILLSLGLAWLLSLGLTACSREDAAPEEPDHTVPQSPLPQASGAVRLSDAAIDALGIQSIPLQPVPLPSERRALGTVVDLEPLLEARNRIRDAATALEISRSALELARKHATRLKTLHDQGVTADRELQVAEAAYASESARLAAAELDFRESREAALHIWGDAIVAALLMPGNSWIERLIAFEHVLVLVTFPPAQATAPPTALDIAIPGDPRPKSATLLGRAPRSDPLTQGATYFYTAAAPELRAGMRVELSLRGPATTASGFLIPIGAVVWAEGHPWVYLRDGPGHFTRRRIPEGEFDVSGRFVATGFAPSEQLVLQGAQSLYAVESRGGQAPSDDD